jgi:5-methylthioadenosine/S-adenosylhomocysteine deaminase
MDEALGDFCGDIVIEGARIREVGSAIDPTTVDEVVDLGGAVVLPGLIDCHVHLWQAAVRGVASGCWWREYFGIVHPLSARLRAGDLYASTFAGAAQLLCGGVTTVFDFCHSTNSSAHARASLEALSEVGIRALFGFSFRERPEMTEQGFTSFEHRINELHRLQSEWGSHERVQLAAALNNIDHVTGDGHAREVKAARELGLVATLHSNLQAQVTESFQRGLLGSDLLWVHTGAISDSELRLLREHGGAIICTPELEAGFMTVTPVVARALQHQVPVAYGTDAPAVVNGDLLTQLRIGHTTIRMADAQLEHLQGRSGQRTGCCPSVDASRLLRQATIESAALLGMADRIGSLTPGKQADITVVGTGPFGLAGAAPADHVLFHASNHPMERVYVAGREVVRAGQLVGTDMDEVRQRAEEARDWVLGRAPGTQWPELDAQTRARYEAGQGSAV